LLPQRSFLNKLLVEEFRAAERVAHTEYTAMLSSMVNGKLTSALSEFFVSDPAAHQAMQTADLIICRGPYIAIAFVVTIMFCQFLFVKLPRTISHNTPLTLNELRTTFKRLFKSGRYIESVIAQAFYVGI
jgi:FHS family L-fucose permease-like MFS transporter